MRLPIDERKNEAGQATILTALALSIFLFGGIGLAVDASNLYAQRQMAQAAADAGAQAGTLSVLCGTNAAFAASSYAQQNGFSPSEIACSASATRVTCTITRTVNTTFMRLLGPTAATVKASATAEIVSTNPSGKCGTQTPPGQVALVQ